MAELSTRIVTVAFSPQSSVAFFMKNVLECVGLKVAAVTSTLEDLEAIVCRDRPAAIVYDVSFPFALHWQQLQELRRRPALQRIPIIVTTSEARELFRATGCSSAIELFARPDDVALFKQALLSAIGALAGDHAAA
jgi:CheY-like chemotaxis protein